MHIVILNCNMYIHTFMHMYKYMYNMYVPINIFHVVFLESRPDDVEQLPSLSYVEPYWSGTPVEPHSLLIIKNGTEIGKLLLDDKPYHTFGRLPNCDVTLEHPSISRYHAILQYRPTGTYSM